ncbi:hypothetical protein SAMN05444405_104182 [Bacteroides luti]|jgi:hypothetical protein|uniref:Uncharacterized protein n=1 Tax=Bacteroides luti TaxID=1297750 RepID=A0A1M4Y0Z5_9BACE|nr:hypothetical protein [Bacteroides luti]SHE99340.1 hypothetical protein SAMN05444405_104182 [Bacteroides luti]
MEGKRVIHLELKETGEHRYFSSPSALYNAYSKEELKIARQSLLNYWQKTSAPYENAVCIIRKGALEQNKLSDK